MQPSPSLFPIVFVAATTFGLVARAETKPPVTRVADSARTPAPPAAPPDLGTATKPSSDVHISDEIRSKCGIPDEDAYFAFNSAAVTTNDRTALDLVARCFRAEAVEGYLTSRGMTKSKASATSRGAMDATGSDEQGWQYDRRVAE